MHVTEEHVGDKRHFGQKLLAEQTQARATVKNDDGLARAKLDATGVPTDLGGARPWRGDAASNSPKGHLHRFPYRLAFGCGFRPGEYLACAKKGISCG